MQSLSCPASISSRLSDYQVYGEPADVLQMGCSGAGSVSPMTLEECGRTVCLLVSGDQIRNGVSGWARNGNQRKIEGFIVLHSCVFSISMEYKVVHHEPGILFQYRKAPTSRQSCPQVEHAQIQRTAPHNVSTLLERTRVRSGLCPVCCGGSGDTFPS